MRSTLDMHRAAAVRRGAPSGQRSRSAAPAEQARPRLIEADVHLFGGRLEVRHLKTLGPLPILWDRWYLAPFGTRRLELGELLAAADSETMLMLDLKGLRRDLAHRVAVQIACHRPVGEVAVCSRSWRLLEPLEGVPGVRVVHSIGSRRQLRALRRRFAGRRLGGVSSTAACSIARPSPTCASGPS